MSPLSMISDTSQTRRPAGRLIELPPVVCFRVTRFCNAHCGFCLAPSDGGIHPGVEVLKHRIDWLRAHGVTTIHFCGGEPTIHQGLAELIDHVGSRRGKSKLTTNGISLPDGLIPALRAAGTRVKVSLHGDRSHHNDIVGRDAFDAATATIHRLISSGVKVSLQTTIVRGRLDVVPWAIDFCRKRQVSRVSFLPFIPRGSGYQRRQDFALSPAERRQLRALIKEKRREHAGRLDIRLLDFNARPIHVIEPDGRVVLEAATEAMDVLVAVIPESQQPLKAES